MKPTAVAMLSTAGIVSICVGALLWYEGDRPTALVLSVIMAIGAVVLIYRASRFFPRYQRAIWICTTILGVLLGISIIAVPRRTDRRSSWNEAVKAMQLLQEVGRANQRYAAVHQGCFAPSLADLHEKESIGDSYMIVYDPIEDHDHIIRHYSLRGTPQGTYWIHIYADETRIIRMSDNGPADRNSRPIL